MHIAALLVAASARIENSAIDATRLPTTSFTVHQLPAWLTIPLVLVLHAPAREDYDPELFIVCKDSAEAIRGTTRLTWQWPEQGGRPSKYRCFTPELSFAVESTGEHNIGVYRDADATRPVDAPVPLQIDFAVARRGRNNGN
ncbi:hypothetical protein [Mycobacterium sp.]|uniref:hypothetical protein n=1 Tax=Mycobacterium sp. TaxID=1785 RepID=UPI003A888F83